MTDPVDQLFESVVETPGPFPDVSTITARAAALRRRRRRVVGAGVLLAVAIPGTALAARSVSTPSITLEPASPPAATSSPGPPTASTVGSTAASAVGSTAASTGGPTESVGPAPTAVRSPPTLHLVPPISTSPRCGSSLPFDVTVQGGTAMIGPTPIKGPAPGPSRVAVGPGQVVVHWVGPTESLELRWPPDPRPLYGGVEDSPYRPFSSSNLDATGHGELSITSPVVNGLVETQAPLVTLTPKPGGYEASGLCATVQVRMTAADGTTETIGVRPLSIDAYDLNPLVGSRTVSAEAVDRQSAVECAATPQRPVDVTRSVAAATPAEALRAYLIGPGFAAADIPTSRRPFHEYRLSARSYRYERFTNWNEHIAITVTRLPQGWAVTDWNHGTC